MGWLLSSDNEFDPALFHQKLSSTDWFFEILRADSLKAKDKAKEMQMMIKNPVAVAPAPSSFSKLSQPMLFDNFDFDDHQPKLLPCPLIDYDDADDYYDDSGDYGLHWACKKQRTSRSPPNIILMHSAAAALDSLKNPVALALAPSLSMFSQPIFFDNYFDFDDHPKLLPCGPCPLVDYDNADDYYDDACDYGLHWACKKQRSSRSPSNLLMQSAALDSLKKNTKKGALKRTFQRIGIGESDDDWAPVQQYSKKQKMMMAPPMRNNVNKARATKMKKKGAATRPAPSSSHHHHYDLPQEFKTEIQRLKGSNLALVIEKELTKTDLIDSGNRLSMPLNQIASTDFLTKEESICLDNEQTMTVQLIDPGLVQGDINLRLWIMGKKSVGQREGSKIYVLRTQWGAVARRNQLKQGDLVQVWSFRVDDLASSQKHQLYLALVLVRRSGFGGDHDGMDSDDGGCKSCVVDADQEIMQQWISGGNTNNGSSSCESSIVL